MKREMSTFPRLVASSALGLAGHMALDERLLELALPWPCLRLYRWAAGAAPCATFGYAQRYADVRETLAPAFRARCTRRITGGGIVLHDRDLTFSLVFPLPAGAPWRPAETYRVLHSAIARALAAADMDTALVAATAAPPPAAAAAHQCFLEPVPADLLGPDGQKVLGGALRRRRDHALYQGSLRLPGARTTAYSACALALQAAILSICHAPAFLALAAPPIPADLLRRYASSAWLRLR